MSPAVNGALPSSWWAGWLRIHGAENGGPPKPSPALEAELARRLEDGRRRRKVVGRWCPHGRRYYLGLEGGS